MTKSSKKSVKRKSSKRKRAVKKGGEKETELVAIISDIHFDLHHKTCWKAFKLWCDDVRPDHVVVLGDFVDLGMLSRYTQGRDDPLFAADQVGCFATEANEVSQYTQRMTVVQGNHDDRWDRHVLGNTPFHLKGALGLSLKEQCFMQGLNPDIEYVVEDTINKGVKLGPFLLRHGHNQSGRFGGGKHLAATKLSKTMGQSEVFGHHHRAQVFCQTAQGKTAIAVANPGLTGDHMYNVDPDWQRGFTILEMYGPNNKYANPYVVIMDNAGHFSYNRKVYDGRK